MHKTVLRIFSQGLTRDMAQLGSFTIDAIQPWAEILHPTRPVPAEYVGTTIDAKVRDTFKRSQNQQFKLFLTKLLKLHVESEETVDTQIGTTKRVIQYLLNHERAFEFLTGEKAGDQKVQEWIQKRVDRRQDVYMIVRTDTFVDANVQSDRSSKRSLESDFSVAPSQVVPGIPPILDNLGQAGVNVGTQRSEQETDGYEAIGERIYAVEYRKISWRWLPPADAATGALGVLFKSLRPGPWTRGEHEEASEQYLLMKVEDEPPEFTEEELEEEELEAYVDKDGADEVEYVFSPEEANEDDADGENLV